MKKFVYVAVALLLLAFVFSSCRSNYNCPAYGENIEMVEEVPQT